MAKTVAYIRVSTDRQDLEVQKKEITDYAERLNMEIDVFQEIKISSKKKVADRGIKDLMESLKRGDILIVSELSRLARSIRQAHVICDDLINKKVTIHFIKQGLIAKDNDMTTKITINAWAMAAEIERDLISSRTKQGLALAKARGRKLGNPNLKATNEKSIEKADKFAADLKGILSGLIYQGMTQREIVENLNRGGVKTARGKKWQLITLQRTMKRIGVNTMRGKSNARVHPKD